MNRFLKTAGLMCLAVSVLGCSGYAEVETAQKDTEVKIYGNTTTGKADINIIANVLAPGMSYEDLLKANPTEQGNIVVYHNQGKTGENGAFEFVLDMTDKPSGLYSVNVTDSGTAELIYTDMGKNSEALKWLTELEKAPTAEEFAEKQADLGFYGELYGDADDEEIRDMLYTSSKNGEFDSLKKEDAISVFEKITVISALNGNKVENIMECGAEIGIDNSNIADFLDLSFCGKVSFTKEFTERLSGNGYDSTDEFDEDITEAFILSAVRYPDGYNNLTELLNRFDSEIGINKKVTATMASKISGNNYDDFDSLAEDINKMSTGSSGGSGSSGGGGGGGRISSSNKAPELQVSTEVTQSDKTEEYHIDIFTDLENVEWAKEAIVYLAELDIVHGDGSFKFYPENNVTREEFTKMVVQAFAPNAEEAEIIFIDVKDSDWFAPYIKKAKGLGIINGQSETVFGSGQNITRQDMACIAANAAKMYGITFSDESKTLFEDDAQIADYARSSVYALRAGGILNGKENNTFCPMDNATRAEAAKIIYGLLEM